MSFEDFQGDREALEREEAIESLEEALSEEVTEKEVNDAEKSAKEYHDTKGE